MKYLVSSWPTFICGDKWCACNTFHRPKANDPWTYAFQKRLNLNTFPPERRWWWRFLLFVLCTPQFIWAAPLFSLIQFLAHRFCWILYRPDLWILDANYEVGKSCLLFFAITFNNLFREFCMLSNRIHVNFFFYVLISFLIFACFHLLDGPSRICLISLGRQMSLKLIDFGLLFIKIK